MDYEGNRSKIGSHPPTQPIPSISCWVGTAYTQKEHLVVSQHLIKINELRDHNIQILVWSGLYCLCLLENQPQCHDCRAAGALRPTAKDTRGLRKRMSAI